MKRPPSGDFQVIHLVRAAAILPVLATHLDPIHPASSGWVHWLWDHFQRNGRYGVCFFFLVSGFLITRILDRGPGAFRADVRQFYVRRAGRILPLFFLSVAVGLALAVISRGDVIRHAYCFKLPLNPLDPIFWASLFLFLFNWAEFFCMGAWQQIGHHWALFWSLAVEEQFYFAYPWVLRAAGSARKLVWAAGPVFLGAWLWRWWVLRADGDRNLDLSLGSFGYFDLIAAGCLLYFAQKKWGGAWARRPKLCWAAALSGFALVVGVYGSTNFNEATGWVEGPTLLALGLSLFLMGALNLKFFELGFWKALAWPGKYSYGNYLFHMVVLYFLGMTLRSWDILPAFLAFAAVSTGLAALSFHAYEKPLNHWVTRRWGKGG